MPIKLSSNALADLFARTDKYAGTDTYLRPDSSRIGVIVISAAKSFAIITRRVRVRLSKQKTPMKRFRSSNDASIYRHP